MAIMLDTVANVVVKPDLSAFTGATVDAIATELCDTLNSPLLSRAPVAHYADCKAAAEKLLERYWIVPR